MGTKMISLGPFVKCVAGELVQARMNGATQWAIVGARDPGYFPLVVLTGDHVPFVTNVKPDDPGDFERYPVAKYGTYEKEYRFVHDPNGPCEIGDDKLSKTAGSLVFTEEGSWHLVVNNKDRRGELKWLHLTTGKVLGERGSHRIAFGKWDLCIQGLKHGPTESTVLSHPASAPG
jgi:hypothetical protein